MKPLRYGWLLADLAVCRLSGQAAVPGWLPSMGFTSITRTAEELSIICESSVVPPDVKAERGWGALQVLGPLPFDAVGILRQIADPLAEKGIPIIAIGTFDTDYVLVQRDQRDAADAALAQAGLVRVNADDRE